MNTNNSSSNNDAARDAGRDVVTDTTYRGQHIQCIQGWNQSVQIIEVNGEQVGHVIFPGNGLERAKAIIDDRLRTRDFLNAAAVQIENERNLKGEGRPAFEKPYRSKSWLQWTQQDVADAIADGVYRHGPIFFDNGFWYDRKDGQIEREDSLVRSRRNAGKYPYGDEID